MKLDLKISDHHQAWFELYNQARSLHGCTPSRKTTNLIKNRQPQNAERTTLKFIRQHQINLSRQTASGSQYEPSYHQIHKRTWSKQIVLQRTQNWKLRKFRIAEHKSPFFPIRDTRETETIKSIAAKKSWTHPVILAETRPKHKTQSLARCRRSTNFQRR